MFWNRKPAKRRDTPFTGTNHAADAAGASASFASRADTAAHSKGNVSAGNPGNQPGAIRLATIFSAIKTSMVFIAGVALGAAVMSTGQGIGMPFGFFKSGSDTDSAMSHPDEGSGFSIGDGRSGGERGRSDNDMSGFVEGMAISPGRPAALATDSSATVEKPSSEAVADATVSGQKTVSGEEKASPIADLIRKTTVMAAAANWDRSREAEEKQGGVKRSIRISEIFRRDAAAHTVVPMPGALALNRDLLSARDIKTVAGVDADLLVQTCAKQLSPELAKALIASYSTGEPWTVGIVGGSLRAGSTRAAAESLIRSVRDGRRNFGVGLMQLNAATLGRYGITPEEALDPCINLQIASGELAELFERFLKSCPDMSVAAAAAVSAYEKANYLPSVFGEASSQSPAQMPAPGAWQAQPQPVWSSTPVTPMTPMQKAGSNALPYGSYVTPGQGWINADAAAQGQPPSSWPAQPASAASSGSTPNASAGQGNALPNNETQVKKDSGQSPGLIF